MTFNLSKLSGEWIGHYRASFDQVVKFTICSDNILTATKITGDEHVPGGEITFIVDLETMIGKGRVSEKEFRNPCWIPVQLFIESEERVSAVFQDMGRVDFRKDD
jgi:hypothetical protein